MAERYAKLAVGFHTSPKAIDAGLLGQYVYTWALCRNADNGSTGRVKIGYFGPNYLAKLLPLTIEQAAEGVDACIAARLLAIDGAYMTIVGWDDDEWGIPNSTERVRKHRERQREVHDNETGRNVTDLSCNGETPSRTSRAELTERADPFESPPMAEGTGTDHSPAGRKKPKTRMPAGWVPDEGHRQLARENSVDLNAEVAKFRDWVEANDTRYVSWSAAFSGWLRRARSYGAKPSITTTSVDDDDTPTLFENGRRTGS